MLIRLNLSKEIEQRLLEAKPRIQVIIGPRQVGKTTAVNQALAALPDHEVRHYATADAVFRSDWSWIEQQWTAAEQLGENPILVLDEIQKIDNWSEIIKKLWDASHRQNKKIRVVLLGSSSLALQTGLSESMTGRFELMHAYHWNFAESIEAFNYNLDQFLAFGGYPGANQYIHDGRRWLSYMKDSIVETVIDKDILQLRKVERPALFKQVFELACGYPSQEISLRKLVGQLQDPGSVETVKHYLKLLEGAFLIRTLQKYSTNLLQKKSSSPKILPLCPALCTFMRGETSLEAGDRGRLFELIVGLDLLRLPGELYYWRHGNDEVDYVYTIGKKVTAIEVKSGRKKSVQGLIKFREHFPNARTLIISPQNYAQFAKDPMNVLHTDVTPVLGHTGFKKQTS